MYSNYSKGTGLDDGLTGAKTDSCWMRGLIMTPKFMVATAAAFLVISIVDWLWQGQVMIPLYDATETMWRPYAEMNPIMFYVAFLIEAFVYTFVVLGLMRTCRWCDALVAGVMLGLIGVAIGIISYNMMPFATNDIPLKWATGFMIEAVLSAVAIKGVNRIMCPGKV